MNRDRINRIYRIKELIAAKGDLEAANRVRSCLPESMRGHSLRGLVNLAAEHDYELVALEVGAAEVNRLPLPALLQIIPQQQAESGHYWVLDKVDGEQVELFDPQSGHRFQQTTTELFQEWTGNVLVIVKSPAARDSGTSPAGPAEDGAPHTPLPGRRLELHEMEDNSGGCCGAHGEGFWLGTRRRGRRHPLCGL